MYGSWIRNNVFDNLRIFSVVDFHAFSVGSILRGGELDCLLYVTVDVVDYGVAPWKHLFYELLHRLYLDFAVLIGPLYLTYDKRFTLLP